MQVTCSCGKVLNVPEKLAGKTARCPACKKIFQMPGAAPESPAPSRITVTCPCGKKLAAPATAAGKKVLCPKCNQELTVPVPARKPSCAGDQADAAAGVIRFGPGRAAQARSASDGRSGFAVEAPPPEPAMSEALRAAASSEPAEKEDEYGLGKPRCPNCKADMPHGAQFCVECGTALATGTKVKVAMPASSKTKKKFEIDAEDRKKLIYGIIALIVIGLLIWYVNKPHGMTVEEMKKAAAESGNAPHLRGVRPGPGAQ